MSQSIRQTELFTAQDWQVLYKALTKINFNASDPPSINKALGQYLQSYYAEDFNDWINSSEMVMVIDLLSWLAGVLAYRTDVSARENFLDTATARESILRLARFLSYNAKRNQCAQGILKVVGVQTSDDVYDTLGNNLKGITINWNDSNNTDWFEQMSIVLSAAYATNNPFGVPVSTFNDNGVQTQLYQLNASFGANQKALPFSFYQNGSATPCEIINMDYSSTTGITERSPNLVLPLHMCYRSDGFGNSSPNTGFFFAFKQGTLSNQTFSITTPIENQIIDLNVAGINQTDVWVQSVDDSGAVTADWTPVPIVFTDNITYNSLPASQRNIFQAITRDSDMVSLRFSDGRFANAPSGLIRSWYRVSNQSGTVSQITPTDMGHPAIALNYVNRRGATKTLTVYLELQNSIENAVAAETIEQIRRRAPLVYATQNRMVSGEDYNTFPLQSNLAVKIKALNRVYSGQSRFIDLNDPTANYADTTVFADDGSFYYETLESYSEIPLSDQLTASELIDGFIQPALQSTETQNWVRARFLKDSRAGRFALPFISWTQSSASAVSSTGYFNTDSIYFRQGSLVYFASPDGTNTWAAIQSVNGVTTTVPSTAYTAGPVTISAPIQSGSSVTQIIPRYASTIAAALRASLIVLLGQNKTFDLWYDYAATDESAHFQALSRGAIITSSTAIRIMSVDCIGGALWRIKALGLRYVFESQKAVKFYFDGARGIDTNTGQSVQDSISILDINMSANGNSALARNYDLQIDKMVRYANGFNDPNRVCVRFIDADNDGYPDDPDTYFQVTSLIDRNTYLFWVEADAQTFTPLTSMIVFETEDGRVAARGLNAGTVVFQIASSTAPHTFWQMTASGWQELWRGYRFGRGRGTNVAANWIAADGTSFTTQKGSNIRFRWNHVVPGDRRVDPSRSNIMDIFVLPTGYDTLVRNWITAGAIASQEPSLPTDFDLRQSFASYEKYKVNSDDIVWHPVKYRYLFGQTADPELRAKFKVIKLTNSSLSDGEIKGKVLASLQTFFDTSLWDFGDSFYFTECSTYLQSQLANIVGSIVIVPEIASGSFGDLFEISMRADEIPISTAQYDDIIMIDANTAPNLRIK